jgi:site-specific DNA recombinase
MRAVIYARYSSENQREASIDDQIRVCRSWLEREGWDLTQVYRDMAVSGATALRPAYQALLRDARESSFEIIVAESLDRLSRDQEDIAALHKRMSFAGIRLVTLAEGEINELHVGLKGTMNALFLKDLAAKTHRGLRGRVEAGRSGGGNAYGYRVVRRLEADGSLSTGERQIDTAEAETVNRIFRAYAAGESPRRIAFALNRDGVPGPRGGQWSASTLNGNRERGTGILNNELYVGRLRWNRLTYVKDPETGKRRSRVRHSGEQIVVDVSALRIVDASIWDAVRSKQVGLDRKRPGSATGEQSSAPFWSKQRPRYLFSGLMRCGVCGGGFSKISAEHFGCSTARNKGATACLNRRTIRRDELEATVLGGLRERLMAPDLFKTFAEEFTREWNQIQGALDGDLRRVTEELAQVRQRIERLVDAITEGTPAAAVRDRLTALEARRLALTAEQDQARQPAPRLHPNLAEVYRAKVADLANALSKDDATEAREIVRGLIDRITLHPENDSHRVEVRGELAAILTLAGGATPAGSRDAVSLSEQIKLVAGTGFEPVTFRL